MTCSEFLVGLFFNLSYTQDLGLRQSETWNHLQAFTKKKKNNSTTVEACCLWPKDRKEEAQQRPTESPASSPSCPQQGSLPSTRDIGDPEAAASVRPPVQQKVAQGHQGTLPVPIDSTTGTEQEPQEPQKNEADPNSIAGL